MSEVLESRLLAPLDSWDADDELESVCKIALWAGHDASDDSLGTFTTLLVALFAAEDATSRWFQAQAAARNVDVGGVLRSRGLRIDQLPSFLASARSGALPVSSKKVWTQSARYLFRRAAKLRARVIRAARTSHSQLGVRHLLAAYLLDSPPGHLSQLVGWGLIADGPESWRTAFLDFTSAHYPDESSGWASLASDEGLKGATDREEEVTRSASAPQPGLEDVHTAASVETEPGVEAIPATGLVELQWTPAALRVLRAALSLSRQARNKSPLSLPEATTHVRSGVLNPITLIFAIVVVAGGATGDESDDLRFLHERISATSGKTEIHLRAYHGFAGQTESSALELAEWNEDELPLVSRDLNDLLFEASRLARRASSSEIIGVRHLLAALVTWTREPDVWPSLELDRQALAAELAAWINNHWPGDDSAVWSAALLGVAPTQLVPGFTADAAQGSDALGVRRDAQSFARVIAAWDVEPPLSIGIFGHWGSGKSFFMNLIRQEIERLVRSEGPSSQVDFPFCRHVVQVSFNAWHYVEANLWASLVDHILRELRSRLRAAPSEADAVTANLATAKELSAKAKHALEQAEADLAAAKGELGSKVAAEAKQGLSLQDFLSRDAWADFPLSDLPPAISGEATRVATALGLTRVLGSSRELAREMTSLRDRGGEWRAYWRFISRGNRAFATAGVVAVAVMLLTVAVSQFSISEWSLWRRLGQAMGALSAILASAAIWIRWIKREIDPVFRSIRSVTDWIETKRRASYAAEQARVEQLKVEVEVARRRVDEAAARVVQAERDVVESTSPRRLIRFIEERLESGDYQRHLGIVATIRRDFESLSVLLRQVSIAHRKAATTGSGPIARGGIEPIDRIILYVDDLDRCPPRRVVEVLEAIHLLLAFPLFVVVVGVDMRWVSQSLRQHHPHLLGSDTLQAVGGDGELRRNAPDADGAATLGLAAVDAEVGPHTATAMDYLEKIFQIPFWLAPMTETGGQALIRSMIGAEPERIADRIRHRAPGPQGGVATQSRSLPSLDEPQTEPAPSRDLADGNFPAGSDAAERSAHAENARQDAIGASAAALRLDDNERQFMLHMAKVVSGSPRRLKRFVNSYRLLKAGCTPSELDRFLTAQDPPHRAVMTLLAIATSSPRASPVVFRMLAEASDEEELAAFKQKLGAHGDVEFRRASLAVSEYGWDGTPNTIRELRHWAGRVARFTFRETGW